VGVSLSGSTYSPAYVVKIAADVPTSGSFFIDSVAPLCGDGYVDPDFAEGCDDAETVDGDGCSSTCQVESGWSCSGQPSSCTKP
jgi:cysteine-rich repeat protein